MILMGCYLMLFDIYVLTDAIDVFSLSVHDTWNIVDADGINGSPWTPDWIREWIVFCLSIYAYVSYDWFSMIMYMDQW